LSSPRSKDLTKRLLSRFPASAGIYQRVLAAGNPPADGYALDQLSDHLPAWIEAASRQTSIAGSSQGKSLFVFGYLRWWLEYGVALSLLLKRLGHQVSFGFLPYRTWLKPALSFDTRRQSEYIRAALEPMAGLVGIFDLSKRMDGRKRADVASAAEDQARIDIQYSLQKEQIDLETDREAKALFDLRLERNLQAAQSFVSLVKRHHWDTVLLPNGSILEFGVLYRMARSLGLRTVTYEFGEQRERIWLAENDEVMLQHTSELWNGRKDQALTKVESEAVSSLYRARMSGKQWGNFTRTWQSGETKGEAAIREQLALSPANRTVLVCTNVVGDSLALKRQLFTEGMADWLAKSVKALADKPDVNLIVRVHPGELLGAGHPSLEIVRETLLELPPHVRLVEPESPLNTYDLIDIADVGLVYTTTVGLEMAMRGLPVIVAGQTHYRGKGFTLDPATVEDYHSLLDRAVKNPDAFRLTKDQMDRAWHYAYVFFFEYPKHFPWHLIDFWQDVEARPLEMATDPSNLTRYREALEVMTGSSLGVKNEQAGG